MENHRQEGEFLLLQMTPDQIEAAGPSFSSRDLISAIPFLIESREPLWKVKLQAIIKRSNDRQLLEALGQALNAPQAFILIENSDFLEPSNQWKLSHIMVGLPQSIFIQVLLNASPMQMEALKHICMTEPIHHHLTLFIHEATHESLELSNAIEALALQIQTFDLSFLTPEIFFQHVEHLQKLTKQCQETLQKIKRALILAWNTNRSDIVDKLTHIKDVFQKYISQEIGHPSSHQDISSGLYALFENRLNAVYGTQDEAVEDDEPSIEALTKLSLWHLEDYWEAGLLPTVSSSELFENLTPQQQEHYLNQTHHNLKHIGLATLGDMKKAHIYSKDMLQYYVRMHIKDLILN